MRLHSLGSDAYERPYAKRTRTTVTTFTEVNLRQRVHALSQSTLYAVVGLNVSSWKTASLS